jgi:predicted MPP superfamily phosphohydrolase
MVTTAEAPLTRQRSRWRRAQPWAAALLALAALGALVWAFCVEPARLVVHRETLALPDVPPLRVAVLSDLHAGAAFIDDAKIDALVAAVAGEQPDLVLLLGDYLNNGRDPDSWRGPTPEDVIARLGRLRAPLGVWAVLGNHDWWYDGVRITTALTSAGIRVLENQAAEVRPGLWLAGLADEMTRTPDPAAALAGVPDGATVLAMTHSPDVFPSLPPRMALTLAGHTHGGQVRLPLVGPLIVPSRFGARYAAGHVVEGGRHLFVTSGVGTSLLPVRFGVPPELVLLTLVRAD